MIQTVIIPQGVRDLEKSFLIILRLLAECADNSQKFVDLGEIDYLLDLLPSKEFDLYTCHMKRTIYLYTVKSFIWIALPA